jgi:hypothetical protein
MEPRSVTTIEEPVSVELEEDSEGTDTTQSPMKIIEEEEEEEEEDTEKPVEEELNQQETPVKKKQLGDEEVNGVSYLLRYGLSAYSARKRVKISEENVKMYDMVMNEKDSPLKLLEAMVEEGTDENNEVDDEVEILVQKIPKELDLSLPLSCTPIDKKAHAMLNVLYARDGGGHDECQQEADSPTVKSPYKWPTPSKASVLGHSKPDIPFASTIPSIGFVHTPESKSTNRLKRMVEWHSPCVASPRPPASTKISTDSNPTYQMIMDNADPDMILEAEFGQECDFDMMKPVDESLNSTVTLFASTTSATSHTSKTVTPPKAHTIAGLQRPSLLQLSSCTNNTGMPRPRIKSASTTQSRGAVKSLEKSKSLSSSSSGKSFLARPTVVSTANLSSQLKQPSYGRSISSTIGDSSGRTTAISGMRRSNISKIVNPSASPSTGITKSYLHRTTTTMGTNVSDKSSTIGPGLLRPRTSTTTPKK